MIWIVFVVVLISIVYVYLSFSVFLIEIFFFFFFFALIYSSFSTNQKFFSSISWIVQTFFLLDRRRRFEPLLFLIISLLETFLRFRIIQILYNTYPIIAHNKQPIRLLIHLPAIEKMHFFSYCQCFFQHNIISKQKKE